MLNDWSDRQPDGPSRFVIGAVVALVILGVAIAVVSALL